jgi:carboxymethylenebutenolidase
VSVPGAVADPDSLDARDVRYVGYEGDGVDAYLVAPSDPQNAAAVIVVHEIFGLNEHIRDVARRFAALGYYAIAPDLYSREGSPEPGDIRAAVAAIGIVPDARVVGDLAAAASLLREQPGAGGGVGCVGFCSGGRYALLGAVSSQAFDAAVACWPGGAGASETTPERPVPVIELAADLACPLLLAVGAEDTRPSADELRRVRDAAAVSGQDVELETYPDAGHAFFNDQRPNYRPDAAFALWPRITGFLAEHLHSA